MLQREHSTIFLTIMKLPLSKKTFLMSILSGCLRQVILYNKTCVQRPLKNRQSKNLNDKWLLNEGRKYYRILQGEHSAILLTSIKR